jgi:hypothetical protein
MGTSGINNLIRLWNPQFDADQPIPRKRKDAAILGGSGKLRFQSTGGRV